MLICNSAPICYLTPGADIADYFNYGFTEETWKGYCEKQRKMKGEVNQLNKIAVSTTSHLASFPCWYSSSQYSHCSPSSSVVSSVSRYVNIFDHLNDIHSRVHVVVVDGWIMMFDVLIIKFRIHLHFFLQRMDLT